MNSDTKTDDGLIRQVRLLEARVEIALRELCDGQDAIIKEVNRLSAAQARKGTESSPLHASP